MPKLKSISTTVGSSSSGTEIALETLGSNQGEIIVAIDKAPDEKKVTGAFIDKFKSKIENLDLETGQIEYILQESAIKAASSSDDRVFVPFQGIFLLHTMDFISDSSDKNAFLRGNIPAKSRLLPHARI